MRYQLTDGLIKRINLGYGLQIVGAIVVIFLFFWSLARFAYVAFIEMTYPDGLFAFFLKENFSDIKLVLAKCSFWAQLFGTAYLKLFPNPQHKGMNYYYFLITSSFPIWYFSSGKDAPLRILIFILILIITKKFWRPDSMMGAKHDGGQKGEKKDD